MKNHSFKLLVKTGLTEIIREPRLMFFSLLFPLFFLGLFGIMDTVIVPSEEMELSFLQYLFPGLLIFALVSIGLLGTSVPLIEMRVKGILKTLKSTPLKIETFILSQIVVRFILSIFQIGFFTLLGFFLGYIKLKHIIPFVLISLLGMVMILTFGFFFGNFFKNVEVASGVLSIFMVPLLMMSGALLPQDILPDSLQKAAYVIPFTYLTDLYHYVLFGMEGLVSNLASVGIIVGVSAIFFYLTIKTFRWT